MKHLEPIRRPLTPNPSPRKRGEGSRFSDTLSSPSPRKRGEGSRFSDTLSRSSAFGLAILFAAALVPRAWSFERETSDRAMQLESERAAPAGQTEWQIEEPGLLPEVQASPMPLPIGRPAYENGQRTAFADGRHGVDEPNNHAECFTFDDLVAEMRNLAQTIGDLSTAPYGHLQDDVASATEMAVIEGQTGPTSRPGSLHHAPVELGPWGVSRLSRSEDGTVPSPDREVTISWPIPTLRRRPLDVDACAQPLGTVPIFAERKWDCPFPRATLRPGFPDESSPGASRDAYLEGVPAATAGDWARW